MSRSDAFGHADIDVMLMADPKVNALAKRHCERDSVLAMTALGLYVATVLASWHQGRRLTLDEAEPGWWSEDLDRYAKVLMDADLLDDERRVPARSWASWYGEAQGRREDGRDRKARGASVGGRARADGAKRDPVTKQFLPAGEPAEPAKASDSPASRPSAEPAFDPATQRSQPTDRQTGRQPDRAVLPDSESQSARDGDAPDGRPDALEDLDSGQGATPDPPPDPEALERAKAAARATAEAIRDADPRRAPTAEVLAERERMKAAAAARSQPPATAPAADETSAELMAGAALVPSLAAEFEGLLAELAVPRAAKGDLRRAFEANPRSAVYFVREALNAQMPDPAVVAHVLGRVGVPA